MRGIGRTLSRGGRKSLLCARHLFLRTRSPLPRHRIGRKRGIPLRTRHPRRRPSYRRILLHRRIRRRLCFDLQRNTVDDTHRGDVRKLRTTVARRQSATFLRPRCGTRTVGTTDRRTSDGRSLRTAIDELRNDAPAALRGVARPLSGIVPARTAARTGIVSRHTSRDLEPHSARGKIKRNSILHEYSLNSL